jgi:hypothetical protein
MACSGKDGPMAGGLSAENLKDPTLFEQHSRSGPGCGSRTGVPEH